MSDMNSHKNRDTPDHLNISYSGEFNHAESHLPPPPQLPEAQSKKRWNLYIIIPLCIVALFGLLSAGLYGLIMRTPPQSKEVVAAFKNDDVSVFQRWLSADSSIIKLKLSNTGGTLLHDAADYGSIKIAEWLISKGADVSAVNSKGDSPLHLAVTSGHENVALLLLNHGSPVNIKNNIGETPLNQAARILPTKRKEIIQLLLDHGADPNTVNCIGLTPLFYIIGSPQEEEVAALLIKHGANCNAIMDGYFSILRNAAQSGKRETVNLLIDNGADVNSSNSNGDTALSLATKSNRLEIVDILVMRGADVNTKNLQGDRPFSIASSHNYDEIARYLTAHGARK